MEEGTKPTRGEKIVVACFIIAIVLVILLMIFVYMPWSEQQKSDWFEENQKIKIGKIILVKPEGTGLHDDIGKVYFEDGSIMDKWQREDYSEFRRYINKEVTITYGEIGSGYSWVERKLFTIQLLNS